MLRSLSWKSLGLVVLFVSVAAVVPAQAQPAGFGDDPEQLELGLVTFGVGGAVHQYFGHNAIWVRDKRLKWAALYNYGMFSFGADMLPNYLKGRLTFWVEPTLVHRTFDRYRQMGRDITVQELNLQPAARKKVVDRLMHDALPENRFYQYHHYRNNCSTRLRDVLDEATGGQLKRFLSAPARFNYREQTRRYAGRNAVVNMALLFWMNDTMEASIKRWHEMFLPLELAHAIEEATYVNSDGQRVALVSNSYAIFRGDEPATPDELPATWVWTLALGIGLGGLAALLGWRRSRHERTRLRVLDGSYQGLLGFVLGIPGLLGFLMWTLTEHTVTYSNENQLLANPLTFALWPLGILLAFGVRWADRAACVCAYLLGLGALLSLVLKALPNFDQDNWIPMALLLPIDLGLAASHWLRARARRV